MAPRKQPKTDVRIKNAREKLKRRQAQLKRQEDIAMGRIPNPANKQ